MDTSSIITGTTLNRYQLGIPSCTASLDVEEFSGAEKLSELYYYTITFTSAEKNIDAAQLLSKPAMLTMGGGALQQLADCKRVHGVITTFRRVNRSEDQSTYQITLSRFSPCWINSFAAIVFRQQIGTGGGGAGIAGTSPA